MTQERVGNKAVQAARKTLPWPQYLRTTLIQLMLLCTGAPIVYFAAGKSNALSLTYGALCAVLPQAYFAVRMSAASRQGAHRAARLGMAAEGGKFVLSAVVFALVFAVLRPEQPGLVFVAFGMFWLVQIIDGVYLLRSPR